MKQSNRKLINEGGSGFQTGRESEKLFMGMTEEIPKDFEVIPKIHNSDMETITKMYRNKSM